MSHATTAARSTLMKAAFLRKPGDLLVEEVPRPACPPDMLLVNVKEIGICGSDLHYFRDGRIGDHVVESPHVLGHEAAGVVAEVGSRVCGFQPGDRVCLEPGLPCMRCEQCLQGHYNLCVDVRFSGAPPHHGMFREFVVHDPCFTHRLPAGVSFTRAALAEPLAVAHNAARKASLLPGETVLVIGAGPIGFSCIEMAGVAGAARIIVSEPLSLRREKALGLGAAEVVDPARGSLVEQVRALTGGRLADCVFEASGDPEGIADAVRCVSRAGRVVFIGMGEAMVSIPHAEVLKKEAVLCGIYRYANDFPAVIALLAAGKISGDSWVSHRFDLADLPAAFALASDARAQKLKVMVTT
jgi:L-iditol 2-dehydrogenase